MCDQNILTKPISCHVKILKYEFINVIAVVLDYLLI